MEFYGISTEVFPDTICMISPWMDNGNIRTYMGVLRREGKLQGNALVKAADEWVWVTLGPHEIHG